MKSTTAAMDIVLDIDRGSRGGWLRGTVRFAGDGAAAWQEIIVRLVRRGTAEGHVTHAGRDLVRVSRTSMTDERREIPFAAEIGTEPPSYQGRLFRIDHRVVARARLQDGRLVEAHTPVVLPAGAGTQAVRPDDAGADRLLAGAGLTLLAGGVTLAIASGGAFEATLGGGITAVVGGALLAGPVRRRWWGSVGVTLQPNPVAPGAAIDMRAEIRPRRDWVLRRAEASLEAEESVDVPDPEGHTVRRERVVDVRTTVFQGQQPLRARILYPLHATLVVPHDAAPSFRCDAGRFGWQVRLRLESGRGLWEDTYPIVVVARGDDHRAE